MGLFSPFINDVTTDLDEPPRLRTGSHGPYPEGFKAAMRKRYADLEGLRVARPPDEVFARACELAMVMPGWLIDQVDQSDRTVYGVATTGMIRFKDDFAIRVRSGSDGSIVDMRSASRVGVGDLGANAKRVRRFIAALARSIETD